MTMETLKSKSLKKNDWICDTTHVSNSGLLIISHILMLMDIRFMNYARKKKNDMPSGLDCVIIARPGVTRAGKIKMEYNGKYNLREF